MKKRIPKNPSQLELALYRLRKIAHDLDQDGAELSGNPSSHISREDRAFIVNALWRIGEGNDPKQELGIKAKPGEHLSKAKADSRAELAIIVMFISTLVAPIEQGGGGLDELEAVYKASEHWGYDPESLMNMYRDHPRKGMLIMDRPIHTLPDRN